MGARVVGGITSRPGGFLGLGLLLLALTLGAAVSALAGEGDPPGAGPAGLSGEDRERLEEGKRKREQERERRRKDPKERVERDRSREAHTDEKVSSGEATDLVPESFGEQILASPGDEPLAGPGERVERFLSDHAALLRSDRDRLRIVESALLPLAENRKVFDLELEEEGDGFSPAEGGAELRLPKRLRDGIAFGDSGVRLRPVDVKDSDPEGRRKGEGVVWPKAWRDADLIAVPNVAGAQLMTSLRSERSPEKLELAAELPDGARLKALDGGERGVRILDRDGETIAELAPPLARDADGEEVPTEMRVEDGRIVLRVEHRGGDWRYPLLLDPIYTDYAWYEGTDRANPNANWVHQSNNDNRWSFSIDEDYDTCYRSPASAQNGTNPDCRGLYIFSSGNTNFSTGEYGRWDWRIPGSTSYLDRVDFNSMALSHRGEDSPRPDLYAGIQTASRDRWIGYRNWPSAFGPASEGIYAGQNVYAGPYAKSGQVATFLIYFDDAGHRDNRVHAYLGGARMHMNDPEPPTLGTLSHDGEAFPTGWTKETFPRLSVAASDPGLGVKSIFLRRPAGEEAEAKVTSSAGGDCQGTRQLPCPNSHAASFDYRSSEQREGVHTFATRALDALGKSTPTREHQLKIDRTAPHAPSSGTLKDANGTTIRSDRQLALRVDAKDESPAGPRAGVGSLEIALNNVIVAPTTTCNADSCRLSRDYALDTATLAEGDHEVRVTTTDRAANKTEETIRFSIDRPGEYRVFACDDAPSGKNNSFTWFQTGSDYAGSQSCPTGGSATGGLYARANSSGSGPRGVGAGWLFNAPANTTLRLIDFDLHSRSGGNAGDQVDPMLVTDRQTLSFYRGDDWGRVQGKAVALAPDTPWVRAQVMCGAASTCDYNQAYGGIALHGATITVADPQRPTVAPKGGTLHTRTWQRGEADLLAGLTDNTGIRRARLDVDDTQREDRPFTCDYTFARPCQDRPGERFTVDTQPMADGSAHALRLVVEDASGHETPYQRTFKVDKTGPDIRSSGPMAEPGWKGSGPHYLTVDAADGSAESPRSGTAKVETFVNGSETPRHTVAAAPGCSEWFCRITRTLRFEEADLREGENTVEIRATDNVGNVSTKTLTVRVERGGPTVTTSGPMHDSDGRWLSPLTPLDYSLLAEASDGADGARSGIDRIRTRVNGATDAQGRPRYKHDVPNPLCPADGCGQGPTPFRFDNTDFRDGVNRVLVEALDRARPANSGRRELAVKLDRAAPALGMSGTLWDRRDGVLEDGVYQLTAEGRDGTAASPSSGMRKLEILVDGQVKAPVPAAGPQDCPGGNCTLSRTLTFKTAEYLPGPHVVTVRGEDQVGNPVQRSFRVINRTALFEPEAKLGLEQFWQYETTDTGAGTQAHVNVATGNLVWHSTPIKNPGRALSSVVNLTYNAQGPVGDELIGYAQAGKGFSLGASGLTRVNEPLDLHREALGIVEFNDLDGTRHRFDRDADGSWRSSPGLNLEFRRFSDSDPKRTYAATRPDGVTHFFDAQGYQTSVEDRNGNVLRFEYEQVLLAGGVACPAAVAATPLGGLACKPRLKRVTDSAGVLDGAPNRSIEFSYYPPTELDLGGLDRVKEISDHGGRRLRLDYDDLGYLRKMTQAHGTDDARSFEFAYETLGVGLGGLDRDLVSVTDPNGSTESDETKRTKTEFTYKIDPLDALPTSPAFLGKRVETLTDRRESATAEAHTDRFTYRRGDGALGAPSNETTKKDARGFDTVYRSDGEARMVERVDARGTRTLQEWDADNNNVKLTEAAGTPDEAVTEMAYDDNGLLEEKTDPEDQVTALEYRHSPGTLLADSGDDDGGEFVSDLQSTTRPNEFELGGDYTTEFELDAKGNPTARVEPDGHRAETDFDARGQIVAERDERSRETTYPGYDPNGLPLEKVDPRGGHWRYTYDAVGNVLTATDPRGGSGEQFRTTLTYDDLDRLRTERVPKDSANGEFIERSTEYDDNGNVEAKVDGEGERFETEYTATDKPKETRSPSVEHVGSDGESEGATQELTTMRYDEEDNLVEQTSPKGAGAGDEDAYSTATSYDEVGERVAEVRRSRGGSGADEDIASSWAFDRRGNVVGEVDANRNERFGGSPAANAKVPERRRHTYVYDKADRRTAAVEDPGGLALRTETDYDANGNKVAETDPRGFEDDASPADYTTTWEYNSHDLKIAEVDPEGGRNVWEYYPDDTVKTETSPRGSASSATGDFQTTYDYWETGELRSKTLPRAADQYGPQLVVRYEELDGAGNPTRIRDARGNAFRNSFYDTGELKSTDRPSWWAYRGDPQGEEGSGEEGADEAGAPAGNAPIGDSSSASMGDGGSAVGSGATPSTGVGENSDGGATDSSASGAEPGGAPDEETGADEEAEAPPREITERGPSPSDGKPEALPESKGKGDFGSVKPEQMPGLMPKAGPTELEYDGEMRLIEIRNEPSDGGTPSSSLRYDSVGRMVEKKLPLEADAGRHITTSTGYDRNGNAVRSTDGETNEDGEENETLTTYDQFDRPVRVAAPGRDANSEEVTLTTYDENGNERSRQTPRGPAFTAQMAYDAIDRLISEKNPAGDETTTTYDGAGNKRSETSPRGNELAQGDARRASFTTLYEHDGRNLMTKATDGLGQETTMAYDENGNQIEVVSPGAARGPGAAIEPRVVRRSYDGRDLPWTETTGTGEDARTKVMEFDGNGNLRREVSAAGVDESSKRPLTDDPGGRVTQDSNATKNATVREYSTEDLLTAVHLPWGERDAEDRRRYRQDFTRDGRGRVSAIDAPYEWTDPEAKTSRTSYTHYDTGWIKTSSDPTLVDPDSGEESGGRAFTYTYDRRGLQLTWMSDEDRSVRREFAPNGTMTRRTAFKPNAVSRTYDYRYNENRSMTRMVDQQANRTTEIVYDGADRETLVDETWTAGRDTKTSYDRNGNTVERRTDGTLSGTSYDGGRTTTYTFDALDRETEMAVAEPGQSANTYLSAYHPSGEVSSQRRPNSVDEETFYRTDGNVSQMRSGTSGEPLNKDQPYTYDRNLNRTRDERGTHAFNARDQLVAWTRAAGQPGAGSTVSYELDGTGQITREQDGQAVTGSRYNGDRLLSQTETAPEQPTVTRRFAYDDLGAITEETKQLGSAEATVETRYLYDAFERLVQARGPGASEDAVYNYDGLDRRDKKEEGSATRDFSYVGLTEELSREQDSGETRLYEYDSAGERTGLTADGGGSEEEHLTYQKDANGSVDALEGENGTVAPENKYAYDPYGEAQGAANPATSAAGRNPFRFEGFYHDSETNTYDMQARQYRPDIGRFLTQDRYESSSGDLNLQSDPLTQNRYAFAGGNPVSRVEWDGHATVRGQDNILIQGPGGGIVGNCVIQTYRGNFSRRGSGPMSPYRRRTRSGSDQVAANIVSGCRGGEVVQRHSISFCLEVRVPGTHRWVRKECDFDRARGEANRRRRPGQRRGFTHLRLTAECARLGGVDYRIRGRLGVRLGKGTRAPGDLITSVPEFVITKRIRCRKLAGREPHLA